MGSTIFCDTKIKAPIQSVFDAARGIEIHQLSTAKTNEKAIAGKMNGLCTLNDRITWRAKHFGIYQSLTVKITVFEPPSHFQDCMVKGAFSFFKHDHYFEEQDGITTMKDVFCYGVPYGFLGKAFDRLILKSYMTKLLTTRNQVIRELISKD
jgi:ligand-binding SRPBCC domain-containing protein